MKREHWKSKVGFVWSAIGSAVGLGSIWRFPYIVGQNGGAAFVLLFCIFLFFISLPVLIGEILIGRVSQTSPCGAFRKLGRGKFWGGVGLMTIVTGFIVSSFYSVICGWTLAYLVEAIFGGLTHFKSIAESAQYFTRLVENPAWAIGTHLSFMALSTYVVYTGVQKGIETWNKVLMPLLFFVLIILVIKGLSMVNAQKGIDFLFSVDWKTLTPSMFMIALGQAFFALSIGQGTMVTYGSYLEKKDNVLSTTLPIAAAVVLVSLLAGIAIFTVVFSVGAEPAGGSNLMFQTLPMVFSQITGGYFLSVCFFLLIFLAGLTSQISAMEPVVSYLMDEKKMVRHKAVLFTGLGAFILGIPSALAFGVLKGYTIFGANFFDAISNFSINVLIPLGGLGAVLLIGWRWGIKEAAHSLKEGAGKVYKSHPIFSHYLQFSIKYLAPIVIGIIFLNLFGLL